MTNEEAPASGFASFSLGKVPAFAEQAQGDHAFRTELLQGVDLTVALRFSDEVMQVAVMPRNALRITKCQVVFQRAFRVGEKALFNGRLSSDETAEVDVFAARPGQAAGVAQGYTFAYLRGAAGCELVGSLDESRGLLRISMDAFEQQVAVQPECPCEPIEPGKLHALCECCCVSVPAEGEAAERAVNAAFARWFALAGVRRPVAKPLAGYTSQQRQGAALCESQLLADLQGACAVFSSLDACGHEKVFLLDSGYCAVGDWLQPSAESFPHGVAPLAKTARSLGFLPGVALWPFACERASQLYAQHPDWVLADPQGKPVPVGPRARKLYALDTLNPQVRDYVSQCVSTLVQQWGAQVLRLDGLSAACALAQGGMNGAQLLVDALDLLRAAAGEDTLLIATDVPLGCTFGRVDYVATCCQPAAGWNNPTLPWVAGREGRGVRGALASMVFRGPLNGRAFRAYSGVLPWGSAGKLSPDQLEMLMMGAACHSATLLVSGNMGDWDARQIAAFQQALRLQQAANA
ncbi:MAG: alpha-galactosidase [Coriobacteriia bacterium]|nr:alpha-galactosidase [Coriobacteriia bacterium]